jgi:hypothetical protein
MAYTSFTLLLFALVMGCGGNNQKLTGTVTFSDDGSPVKAGTVILESGNKMGRGDIDANGKFVMGFGSDRDGIPKGETYKVTIVNALEETGIDRSGMPIMTPLIDAKYNNASTSGFTFTSDGTTKTLDLKVERYPN